MEHLKSFRESKTQSIIDIYKINLWRLLEENTPDEIDIDCVPKSKSLKHLKVDGKICVKYIDLEITHKTIKNRELNYKKSSFKIPDKLIIRFVESYKEKTSKDRYLKIVYDLGDSYKIVSSASNPSTYLHIGDTELPTLYLKMKNNDIEDLEEIIDKFLKENGCQMSLTDTLFHIKEYL